MKFDSPLRSCLVGVLLLLMVLSQLGIAVHTAGAESIVHVNVQTDKQVYNVGDTVKVTGNVTIDGTLKNDSLVGVEVDFPTGTPFVLRTVDTGNVTGGYWKVIVLDVYTSDGLFNNKTLFNRGDDVYVNIVIDNLDVVPHAGRVGIYLQASDNTPLSAFSPSFYVGGGKITTLQTTFRIGPDAPLGEVRIFASLFSDNPANTGTPYCPEETGSFYVQALTPPMPPPPQHFNVTFALPVKDLPRGNYTVYATTQYILQLSIDIRQSLVPGPVPIFTYSPLNPNVGQIVTFNGSASYDPGGTVTSWVWDFGDGEETNGSIVTHVYQQGEYIPVTLTVYDNDRGWNSTTKFVNVVEAWPMFHHAPNHWGESSSLSPVTNATLWSKAIGPNTSSDSSMHPSPAVYPGSPNVVFAASMNGTIYALSANNGQVIWKTTPASGFNFSSSPAVGYGVVVIGSENGTVFALNSTTGAIMYTVTTGSPVYSSAAVYGDRVFIGSRDKQVRAFYVNGTAMWTSPLLDEAIDSSPALANHLVFAATWNGTIYALNDTTGAIQWRTSLTPDVQIYSSPVAAYGTIFIGGTDNKLYALSAANGAMLWNFTTGNAIYSSPAYADNLVFVGSTDGSLYALNASTGLSAWSQSVGQVKWSSPAVAEGKVFVGTADGGVYALRENSGDVWWSYQTGVAVDSSPSVLNDTLFACSKSGSIYAFYNEVHDVSVTSVSPSTNLARKGQIVTIQANVWNKGSFDEAVNVTGKYDSAVFYSAVYNIQRGDERLVSVQWDTTPEPTGTYTIFVNATISPPYVDVNPSDNYGSAQIKIEYADIAIVDLTPSTPGVNLSAPIPIKSIVAKGYGVTLYATVRNKSNFTESNVQVTFYWSNSTFIYQTIGNGIIPTLPNGTSVTASFNWTASEVAYGNYTLSAYASPVLAEANTTDNFYTGGAVRVVIPGDVTSPTPNVPEGKVDMRDIGAVAGKFGTKPTSSNWDPNKDVNNDGMVNMRDIGIAASNFGKKES